MIAIDPDAKSLSHLATEGVGGGRFMAGTLVC
jgi:hypothetical protein